MSRFVLLVSLLVLSGTARADSIGPCPDGQEVVMNPTEPGADHHGGYHCEGGGGGCSVSSGGTSASAWALAALVLGASAIVRRR